MTTEGLYTAVINLVRADDRRALQERQLEGIGLEVEFFPACDMLDPQIQARAASLPDRGPWTVFYIQDKACTLSHLDVMKTFLDRSESHCLILEDDIHAARDLALWASDLRWWPADADIVKIETWTRKTGPVLLGSPVDHLGRRISRLFSRHQGGAGYVISRSGAEKVLGAPGPVDVPIDHLLFNPEGSALARNLVVYQVWPALVKQGNEPPRQADAPPRTAENQNKIARELKRLALKLKRLPTELRLRISGKATPRLIAWQDQMTPVEAG